MSLFQFSITTSLILTLLGLIAWLRRNSLCESMLSFGRSNKASVFLLTVCLIWFLFDMLELYLRQIFGNYKLVIGLVAVFIYFGSIALVLTFWQFVPLPYFVCFTHEKYLMRLGSKTHQVGFF